MPNRTRRRSMRRTEARRRAREAEAPEATSDEAPGTEDHRARDPRRTRPAMQGGFLRRAFPPAPPLPGKPDPLAGFTYTGRGRRVVEHLWLLVRNPLAWVVPAGVWGVAQYATMTAETGFSSAISSMVAFASLIAAGWIGWQRPWLYGAAAAAFGTVVLFAAALLTAPPEQPGAAPPTTGDVLGAILSNAILYALIGGLAGWYGGYLRRRLAAGRAEQGRPQQRRR